MSDSISPLNILTAMNRIEGDLEILLGPIDWKRAGPKLTDAIHRLRESKDLPEQENLADELIDFIQQFKPLQDRLRIELGIQSAVRNEMVSELAELYKKDPADRNLECALDTVHYVLEWDFEFSETLPSDVHTIRRISMNPGGKQGGRSIKFRNLRLDFGEVSEIIGGGLLAGYAAIDKPHPFIVAASLLLTIRAVLKAMTVHVSEQDASVFWGFLQARDRSNLATEQDILGVTNQERKKYGLERLSQLQLSNSLVNLEHLQAVERSLKARQWRIVENYRIQN